MIEVLTIKEWKKRRESVVIDKWAMTGVEIFNKLLPIVKLPKKYINTQP